VKALIDKYVQWIREGLSFRQIGEWAEITTPFLNHNNDMISIYVKKNDDRYYLTDNGQTLNELHLAGVNLDRSEKRTHELNVILNGLGIKRSDNSELFTYTDEKRYPEAKHRLIQAVLSIDDMFMLAEPKVESFFLEDVINFFELNEVRYIQDILYSGRSGFTHKFDFSIPKSKKNPETIIKAINTPRRDTIGTVLWAFEDTKNIRDASGLVILNDKEKVHSEIFDALKEYQLEYILWSQRQSSVKRLAA
jgi:hypothetical protein